MADWYTASGTPAYAATLTSALVRAEFTAIQTAMAKLPTLTGNGSKGVAVNSGGTALEALSASSFRTLIGVGSSDSPTFTGVTTTNFTLGGTAITASGVELNYTDGVTSNIQTQIDGLSGLTLGKVLAMGWSFGS